MVFSAKSINFETLDQKAFAPVREAVEAMIETETGIKPDELLRQMEAAA